MVLLITISAVTCRGWLAPCSQGDAERLAGPARRAGPTTAVDGGGEVEFVPGVRAEEEMEGGREGGRDR